MNVRDAKRFRSSSDPDVRAEAARILAAAKARKARTAPKRAGSVARKAAEKERAAELYAQAKKEASERASKGQLGVRCEYVIGIPGVAKRCPSGADDPDHILGGAMRKECERLGAEGLMCLCRGHHDMKHASTPTRGYWLDVAEEHALRHGYRRLLGLVSQARRKYECKHPEAVR